MMTLLGRFFGFISAHVIPVLKDVWPAYLLASTLILIGFTWGLPDRCHRFCYNDDETRAVVAVNEIAPPGFNPRWYPWGTGLFYQVYAFKLLAKLGGLELGENGLYLIGRVISLASALGSITLVYLLGRNILDAATGRLAALILSVLPGFVINAHYFKTDVPMTFWLLATMWAAYRVIQTGTLTRVIVLGLLAGYATSIKYSAAIMVPVGMVAIWQARQTFQHGLPWIAYPLAVAAGFVVGEPRVLRDAVEIVEAVRWVGRINRTGIPYFVARPHACIDYTVNIMSYAMTVPLLCVTAIGVLLAAMTQGSRLLPIWTMLGLYYLILAMDNYRTVRYVVPLLPFAALFAAYATSRLLSLPRARHLALAGMFAILGYAFLFSLSYVRAMAQTDPRTQACQWVERELPRDEAIPVLKSYRTNISDLKAIGFTKRDIDFDIEALRTEPSPYLIVSEYDTRFYVEAIEHYPKQKAFLEFVALNYQEVAGFENRQAILGIDSKLGASIPADWLQANPRISIYRRVER